MKKILFVITSMILVACQPVQENRLQEISENPVPTEEEAAFVKVNEIPESTLAKLEPVKSYLVFRDENHQPMIIDPLTGTSQKLLEDGYELLDIGSNSAEILFLRKNNEIFNYDVNSGDLALLANLQLKNSELVRIEPSISIENEYFLEISDVKPVDGMYPYEVVSSREYIFNEETASLTELENFPQKGIENCYKFDSKYKRFITWMCGEGIGSSIPIQAYNYETGETKVLVEKNTEDWAKVRFSKGQFILFPGKGNDLGYQEIGEIEILSLDEIPSLETLNFPPGLLKNEDSVYGVEILSNGDLVIGGGHSIALLKRKGDEIIEEKILPAKESYINSILVDDNKLYFNSKEEIIEMDIQKWEMTKIIFPQNRQTAPHMIIEKNA